MLYRGPFEFGYTKCYIFLDFRHLVYRHELNDILIVIVWGWYIGIPLPLDLFKGVCMELK